MFNLPLNIDLENDVFAVDKPIGMTSFDVVRKLKKILNVKKIGHGGTLDPLATGILVIGVGKGTKRLQQCIDGDKEYIAEIKFGEKSATFDREGPISKANEEKLKIVDEKILDVFRGEILQTPPIYSAKKIKGVRASDRVRSGQEVKLEPQKVKIYELEVLNFDQENQILKIRVVCSKGTYIRSLANDIGEELGVGGYLWDLRRVRVGEFKL
ncbi:tRNA pseudouridine(55) synthase TruB [Candidatus Peregrinibacteria bacterium RIFOXYA2_FULL_33_7]|nr:MAG: tRNA pseudouridine(55) synthase TruB [Candidatus Peregrinibacteria bacterium RIFOXYA2_FULL_33_7]